MARTTKPRKNSKKSLAKPKKAFWWPLLGKVMLVGLVCLGAYLFYLDAQIQQRFNGNKWQVPAQLYARPLRLFEGQEIAAKEIVQELKLLSYRKVRNAEYSGEYSMGKGSMRIVRRAFEFADGNQPMVSLEMRFANGRIASIRQQHQPGKLQQVRLDPWLVTRFVGEQNEDRMLVHLQDVPQALKDALLVTEDKHFYQHQGVAPLAILRALIANIKAGKTVQGGSTLTQQLVKNLFLTREKSLSRKVKEALMSLLIDARYSKDQILQAYMNEVYLGQNGRVSVHGFSLASQFYFDRPLHELGTADIATLVAMVKGPSYYNPRKNPERVKTRRDLVLKLMFNDNLLQPQQYQRLLAEPLQLSDAAKLRARQHPAFMDMVKRELKQHLGSDTELRDSGLRVFTTLDSNAQRTLEVSTAATLKRLESSRKRAKKLQAAVVVSDIQSGEIRALVGDRRADFAGFNRALDARRLIGSVIKPAIYVTALQQPEEFNLATPLPDKPMTFKGVKGENWQPQNADKRFRQQVSLLDALVQSLNLPTVALGMALGLENIDYTLQDLGVQQALPLFPALTLGAAELSPLQVAQMYQTLSNNGAYIQLHAVQAISSNDGQLLWQFSQSGQQRIDAKAAYLLNYALHKVTLQGTAKAIKQHFPNINMAGKTGTTDDNRDSWFSGFDKYTSITTWIGRDDNKMTGLTGANGALRLFIDYQKRSSPKSLSRRFPKGLGIAHFDRLSGLPVQAGCKDSLNLPAILAALSKKLATCNQPPPRYQRKKSFWDKVKEAFGAD